MSKTYTLYFYNSGGEREMHGAYKTLKAAEAKQAEMQAEFGDDDSKFEIVINQGATMPKLYKVTYTLTVTEEVEADSKEDAEQAFSELFSDAQDLLEMGTYKIKRVKESA
jgi:hypothetical protein